MPVDVFISYRGADRVLARKLEQRLRSRWGSRVFRDETSLMSGRPWSKQLLDAMSQAKVMLALIGPGWHVRDDGEDWVRNELLGAIKAGNPVLPVLVGNADKLKDRLGDLPDAFKQQAVKVSGDLVGFDLHKIEKALRNLGAFGGRHSSGLSHELSEVLPERCNELVEELLKGRSIVVSGASGSGRTALLKQIAATVNEQGGLVAASGINLSSRHRRTHCVVASWIDDLCELLREKPRESRLKLGTTLINAVLEFGPDLLSRQVLRSALLLPLGNDESDQKILDAVQRPTDRWAPFPPERLVSQSMSVIEKFVLKSNESLILIIDNVESIDGSSRDLVKRLLRSPIKGVSLVLATSAVKECAAPERAERSVARELDVDEASFTQFSSISLHDPATWGQPGAVIQRWLDKHKVRLGEGVSEIFVDSNPYYALSALWYLVDNGHLVEPPRICDTTEKSDSPEDEFVTWVPAHLDEPPSIPGREKLLDHMIEEFVPVGFRSIIEAGSLIGRRFPFSAAYAATHPAKSIDGQPPGSEAIKRWNAKADKCWVKLSEIDQEGSVIVCHSSADNERMINFAQVDLMTYLSSQLSESETLNYNIRLAQYFSKPIADDAGRTIDDNYGNSQAAATHWARARELRHAADAERIAAKLAEKALAYPEARRHFRRAIRQFTQILANKDQGSSFNLVDHQDLLILANCLYHLGQMTRLANERGSGEASSLDPIKYFDQALKRLKELSQKLHDKHLLGPAPELNTLITARNLPEPNVIRHNIRLCENLSGWVNLELAEWYGERNPKESRRLLFDALRHAEAARGEADSRWLLAAASAELAQKLVDDAFEAQQSGNSVRSHNLAIEAQFHIERVIGIAAVSSEEERNLEEPRSRAWTVLGQLFQTIEMEPQLAEWAYRRMNDHRKDVSDLVDMKTDRRLGLFLLSKHCGVLDPRSSETRELLESHKKWAIESGIAFEHSGAYISLALLELVEQSEKQKPEFKIAREHVDSAVSCAFNVHQKQDAYLLRGLLHAIENRDNDGVAYDDAAVIEAFRKSGIDGISEASTKEDTLKTGWRTTLIRLLRWCPHVEKYVGLERYLQKSSQRNVSGQARFRFFNTLANEDEVRMALNRANTYFEAITDERIVPSGDKTIWRLLKSRVPTECYRHALRARAMAYRLLNTHLGERAPDDVALTLSGRDMAYAIAVHEWYRSTDPSRLLTLARESNMQINGHEWASPKLLSGRLAIQVLDSQYGAEKEIGRQRLAKIESMIVNWTDGLRDAGPLEQIFYIAVQLQAPVHSQADTGWRDLAHQPGKLKEAYLKSVEERKKLVRQAGLPLVQDLHLLDDDATPIDVDLGDEQTHALVAEVERQNATEQKPPQKEGVHAEHEPRRVPETQS